MTPIILVEDILELLRAKATFVVVCHTITAVFILVQPRDKYTEERVGKPTGACWVREANIDDVGNNQAEGYAPTPGTAAVVGIGRPDYAVAILVPVISMLLHDLEFKIYGLAMETVENRVLRAYSLMFVAFCITTFCGPIRMFFGRSNCSPSYTKVGEMVTCIWDVRFAFFGDWLLGNSCLEVRLAYAF